MNKIVKFECACETGYDKGAIKKTIENNIFTVFGNPNQNNSIVIRYHGMLTENDFNNSTAFHMFYYFDQLETDKKVISLEKCTKCPGECYCTNIDLGACHSLSFGFFNQSNEYELNCNKPFELSIAPDPIATFMQRHGLEQNVNLPTIEVEKTKIFAFQDILCAIKCFFSNLLSKPSSN